MGQIQRYKDKIIVRFTVDEVLFHRVTVSRDVTFTLAEMIREFAQMKAMEKRVVLKGGIIKTSFDPVSLEFVVTFSSDFENAIYEI